MSPEDEFGRKDFRRALVLGYFFKFSTQVNHFVNVGCSTVQHYTTDYSRTYVQLCSIGEQCLFILN